MRYDLLLLDADDTLFDFAACEDAAIRATLKEASLPDDDATVALYSRINLSLWKALERGEITQTALRSRRFALLLEALGRPTDGVAAMSERFVAHLSEQRFLLPCALPFVHAADGRLPMALVTNGIASVQRARFSQSPLAPYFKAVVISGEIGVTKPDPRVVWEAMRLCGVADRRRVLLIGDSLSADIACAVNAGVDSCLVTGDRPLPDALSPEPTYVARDALAALSFALAE